MHLDGTVFTEETTIQWTFTNGPAAGVPFEHRFLSDGSVVWRALGGRMEGASARESEYRAFSLANGTYAISYLAESGYTLTVVIDPDQEHLVGFASNESEWYALRGTYLWP